MKNRPKFKQITFSLLLILILPYFFSSAQTIICYPNTLKPLKYGQQGKAVKNLQACLIQAGYQLPQGITGIYDIQTKNAVKEFYADWHGRWSGYRITQKGIDKLKEKLNQSISIRKYKLNEPESISDIFFKLSPNAQYLAITYKNTKDKKAYIQINDKTYGPYDGTTYIFSSDNKVYLAYLKEGFAYIEEIK